MRLRELGHVVGHSSCCYQVDEVEGSGLRGVGLTCTGVAGSGLCRVGLSYKGVVDESVWHREVRSVEPLHVRLVIVGHL